MRENTLDRTFFKLMYFNYLKILIKNINRSNHSQQENTERKKTKFRIIILNQ